MEKYCFFFALLILLLHSISLCSFATISDSATDKHALLSFKTSLISDPHAILSTNWSDDTPVCNWIGVSCGLKHPRVTALNLSGYDLAGTLPPHLGNLTFLRYLDISFNNFTGFVPFQLSNLHRLRVVNASVNSFTGDMPTWLGSLPQLRLLIMSNNSLSGRIPPSLFNNSKLQIVNLRYNHLSGNIPEEIGNASSLQMLYLDFNQLSGSIPSGMFNVSGMRQITIMFNSLTGWLPSDMCSNIPNLNTLLFMGNQLSGEIPANIGKCRSLEWLALSDNHFRGNIPTEIGSLGMLTDLYLSSNNFTGRLPVEIGNLSRLEMLDLHNASISGNIPSSIFNISSLLILSLSYNSLTGSLPSHMGNSLPNLEWLALSSNNLNGPIPSSIVNASKLTMLYMANNFFNGSIPNFGNLRLLQILDIHGNHLSGAESPTHELIFLSSLTNCGYLKYLVITDNPLNGILPTSIGNLSTSLLYFYASNCHIKGVIPSEIGNLSNLLYMILYGNQVTRFIPPTIGKMKKLQRLYLDDNQLIGSIPNDLCQLSSLGDLSLSENMLIGPIPECLGGVKSLKLINLGSNQLNSTIPSNLWTLTDLLDLSLFSNYFSGQLSSQLKNLKALVSLDLSMNQLSGDIPSTIGGCQSIEFLNLSYNEFGGSIPQSLGNVRDLMTLDLSNNSLSGLLPKSLANIQSLLYFNVSYNKLEGEIPNEGCFANFTAQSFVHNSALCGPAKFQVPPCLKNQSGSRVKSFVHLTKYIAPSLILVIILVIAMLVLGRRKNQKKVSSPTPNIVQAIEWRRISYIELERGTSSFNETNLLGIGAFGSVFLATLSDGLKVAAKVFNLQLERAAQSFDTESELLSMIRHRNIVHVIGCCSNMEFKALILEYMPNGSLEKWLYSHNYCLDLVQRLKIAIDVALALEYLHHGYTFPIVHCDVKPSNVLLDEDMNARVADFGIAKLFEKGVDVVHTKTLATIGYAAPEYGSEGKVSINGDVYSYGIMLLEMFTRRRPTDDLFTEEMSLKEWVGEALQKNVVSEVADPHLLAREDPFFLENHEECVSSIFGLAMKCVVVSPTDRINMIEVTTTLEKIKATFEANTRRHQRYVIPMTG